MYYLTMIIPVFNSDDCLDVAVNSVINQTIGFENIELLFNLKRADLLAQSPEYHNLLININKQEQGIIKVKKLKRYQE